MRSILLADNVHINERNFLSLLDYLKAREVEICHPVNVPFKYDNYGHYDLSNAKISAKLQRYADFSLEQLAGLKSGNTLLIEICRAELLSALIPECSNKFTTQLASGLELVEIANKHDRALLLSNLAAAEIWTDYWRKQIRDVPRLSYIGVFSGSLTYARALIEVAKLAPARCFVLESLFTGHHFYCEERYMPIANRSDIRHDNVYSSKRINDSEHVYEIKRNAAIKILSEIKRRNQ